MDDPGWPLAALRLGIDVPDLGHLTLWPAAGPDQRALAELVPADLELDPAATRFAGLPDHASRAVVLRQAYWRSFGTWSTTSWRLPFAVRLHAGGHGPSGRTDPADTAAGRLVGEQELEGQDFPTLRTVDTSSWLVPDVRGRGLGRLMRRAVLALAFGPLGALAAVSSAWPDNRASLGVSRILGYLPNGEHLHVRGDGLAIMTHVRLTRADWLAGGHGNGVRIEGFDGCRPFFGLGPPPDGPAR